MRSADKGTGMRFLGSRLATDERRLAGGNGLPGYPPRARWARPYLIETEQAVVLPRDQTRGRLGYALMLGYEVVDEDEIGYRSLIEVLYEVDGTHYRWRSPSELIYCPDRLTEEECEAAAKEL